MFYKKEPEDEPIQPSQFGGVVHGMSLMIFFLISMFFQGQIYGNCGNIFIGIFYAFLCYLGCFISTAILFVASTVLNRALFENCQDERQRKIRKIVITITYIIIILVAGIIFTL